MLLRTLRSFGLSETRVKLNTVHREMMTVECGSGIQTALRRNIRRFRFVSTDRLRSMQQQQTKFNALPDVRQTPGV